MDPIPQGLRERKKRQTRLDLASAALRLFEERGFDAVTVDDIAAEANVSRRTFFRYFETKEDVIIVEAEGKIAAMRSSLRDGPPDEPTLDALRRGSLALIVAYWDADLAPVIVRLLEREPKLAATVLAYQVRFAETLAYELAIDLGVDVRLDPRPRILAHAAISMLRTAMAARLAEPDGDTPIELAEAAFDRGRPALEAILALPTEQPRESAA